MPSFLEGLRRLLVGEPVFREGEGVDGVTHKSDERLEAMDQQAQGPLVADAVVQPGTKVIPQVFIERVEYRNNGSNMEVTVNIRNDSTREVMVDKIMLLGASREIDRIMQPGEEREIPVFSGPRPNHRNYTDCELQYRDQATGDYFSSVHIVEFEQEADNTYVISRIRFIPPIKDI